MARTMTATVVSTKPDKTIIVRVDRHKSHPIYKKNYLASKNFAVHDEKSEAGRGDLVEIVETAPVSKTKRWALKKVIEKSIDPAGEVAG